MPNTPNPTPSEEASSSAARLAKAQANAQAQAGADARRKSTLVSIGAKIGSARIGQLIELTSSRTSLQNATDADAGDLQALLCLAQERSVPLEA